MKIIKKFHFLIDARANIRHTRLEMKTPNTDLNQGETIRIVEVPADEFFPIRYTVQRADGKTLHPSIGRDYCEHLLASIPAPNDRKSYVVVRRKAKAQPWRKVCDLDGSCLANAENRAWLMGLISYEGGIDYATTERVVHQNDWHRMQVKQHLKAIKH